MVGAAGTEVNQQPALFTPECSTRGRTGPSAQASVYVWTGYSPKGHEMYRRRGRTIGTVLIGTFVLLAFGYALFGDGALRTMPSPVMKAAVSQSERSLAVGASVLASDRTNVGTVSGISRRLSGHIERIRVTTASPLGLGARTIIIRDTAFSVENGTVVLSLSVAQVEALPGAMTTDGAAGFMGPF